MSHRFYFQIEKGPDKGKRFNVSSSGGTIGRSSSNDIALLDPLMSRRHSRYSVHEDGTPWIEDAGSANETHVNGKRISKCALHPGDRIAIGDTVLALAVENGPPASRAGPVVPGNGEPVVDLGFVDGDAASESSRPLRSARFLSGVGAVVALLLLGAVMLHLAPWRDPDAGAAGEVRPLERPEALHSLSIHYEKVEADPENIFRYDMRLSPDRSLAVIIDDLSESRHVRKDQVVDDKLVRELARDIASSGFFALDPRYEGVSRQGSLRLWSLEVILDGRAHRTVVRNRVEPDGFRQIRERLETFGKNELGLWAIQFSRERLIELSHAAYLFARKRFDERDIEYGNLATALSSFREAELYLETVDPKPDFHERLIAEQIAAEEEFNERYAEQRFRVDRALNLSHWDTAARELRILIEMVPDRDDKRNREATRKLLDVEARLRTRRRSP